MQVYLVQHGEAKAEAEDPARPLTDRGREEVRRVARHAAAVKLQVAEIRHSGRLRARLTAEILAEHLSPPGGTREIEGLGPTDDPGKARREIEAAQDSVMLVGHLPHLSRLASSLLAGDPGREIEGPMAVVILGGLVTSTALNLLVLPMLALRFGRFEPGE